MERKSLLSLKKGEYSNVSVSRSYRQANKTGCIPVLGTSMGHSEIKRFSQGKSESIRKLFVL